MISFSKYTALIESYSIEPNTQYGSNYGGIGYHKTSGEKVYVKIPNNPRQSHSELLASELYTHFGIRTTNPKIDIGTGGIASTWNPNLVHMSSNEHIEYGKSSRENALQYAKLHHAAILTGNRDILGLDFTNVMRDVTDNRLVSLDQGGSFEFRAMGGHKDYKDDILDIHSFKNPEYSSGQVFPKIFKEHQGVEKEAFEDLINNTSNTKIKEIFGKHAPQYFPIFSSRFHQMKQHYGF